MKSVYSGTGEPLDIYTFYGCCPKCNKKLYAIGKEIYTCYDSHYRPIKHGTICPWCKEDVQMLEIGEGYHERVRIL